MTNIFRVLLDWHPQFFSPSGIPVLAQYILNTYVHFSVYIYCHSQCICPQGNIDFYF